jgi:putative solute:sodium symporter small subunit
MEDLASTSSDHSAGARSKGRADRFPALALFLWAIFAFAIPLIVQPLNLIHFLGFPLGFYMLAQGGLMAFLLIAIVSAWRQDRVDARQRAGD